MGLQRKLFLLFGLIILLIVIVAFVFSQYFVSHDLKIIEKNIQTLVSQGALTQEIAAAALFQHHQFVDTLLLRMFIIALAIVFFALGILWMLIHNIVRPLKLIAAQSEKIAAGEYGEIILPELGRRKDEIATLTNSYSLMVEGLKDREKIRGVLDKVVSKDVATEILKSTIHLGGEDRIVTILFSDIRNFTEMTEYLSPQATIGMLNEYMTKMSRVAEAEGGVIDKYIGDEIMILYGVPIFYQDHAIRALSTAKIMMETLKNWNEEREAKGQVRIEAGIGIHTGIVLAGNMGAEDRLNYTVVGAGVNLASRLCSAAAPMQILISEYTLKEPYVEDSFFVEKLKPIPVKGFTELVNVYTITGFKWE